jgi:putative two-component system response regulator
LDKPFVLLADDNEATCTLLTALLQSDFIVHVARDGGEAIERLKTTQQYAAILLDLLMPVFDGYEVLDFLSDQRPDLLRQVIIVTAAVGAREMERVHRYDIRAVVPKPFEVDALHSAVRECAGLSGPHLRGSLISGGMLLLLAEVLKRASQLP